MPISYNPGISYTGDQYAFKGLSGLGSGIGDAIAKFQKKQEEDQQLAAQAQGADLVVSHAYNAKLIPQVEYIKYQTLDAKGKIAASQALSQNITTDAILQKQQAQMPMQNAQLQNLNVRTAIDQEQLQNLRNPPPPFRPTREVLPPITPDSAPIDTIQTSPGKWQVMTPGGEQLQLTADELAAYKATGKIPLRTSAQSFQAANDPTAQLATNSDAVKQFNTTIGNTYGVKAADLYQVDFRTPKAIKYVNSDNESVSTEEAAKLGYGATAVVPFGERTKRIPLPEWNTIVNQWQQLPKAGGVTVQGGAGSSNEPMIAVTSPSGVPGFLPQSKLKAALAAGYKQQ